MDIEQARSNMIEQQIRPWDVSTPNVLSLFREVPREAFVSKAQRSLAFADLSLPIGHDEVMWQPKIEARILQALAPQTNDHALEMGTGSGYLTALLATCTDQVTSVDIYPEFLRRAKDRLSGQGIHNVDLVEGDGARGWAAPVQWGLIVLTGSLPTLPASYREILAPGGRLVAVIGQEPVMEAMLYTHHHDGQWTEHSLFDTYLPPLLRAEQSDQFDF